jgi:hypothetical protein
MAPVWFSFWAASGRQKPKLEPNAQILARLLRDALPIEAPLARSARSRLQLALDRIFSLLGLSPIERVAAALPPPRHRSISSPHRRLCRYGDLLRELLHRDRLFSSSAASPSRDSPSFLGFAHPRQRRIPVAKEPPPPPPPVVVLEGTGSLPHPDPLFQHGRSGRSLTLSCR